MVPQLIARVDGLPVSLLERESYGQRETAAEVVPGCRPGCAPRSSARPQWSTNADCRCGLERSPTRSTRRSSGWRSAPSWSPRGCCRCAAITTQSAGRRRC